MKKSLLTGELPDMWKNSVISPIFKKVINICLCKLRPVVLTSVACKIVESVFHVFILEYLSKYNLISKYQHSFSKNHSTGCQLLECLYDWPITFENNTNVDVCYIKFCKVCKIPELILNFLKMVARKYVEMVG